MLLKTNKQKCVFKWTHFYTYFGLFAAFSSYLYSVRHGYFWYITFSYVKSCPIFILKLTGTTSRLNLVSKKFCRNKYHCTVYDKLLPNIYLFNRYLLYVVSLLWLLSECKTLRLSITLLQTIVSRSIMIGYVYIQKRRLDIWNICKLNKKFAYLAEYFVSFSFDFKLYFILAIIVILCFCFLSCKILTTKLT